MEREGESGVETRREDRTGSSVRAGVGGSAPTPCAVCGAAVETTEWHPVVSARDGDGAVTIRSFCGQDCREKWDDS